METPSPRGRVAVLALQRLGDMLTGARITAWLASHPDVASVELIHFDATTPMARMMPGVDRRHTLAYSDMRQVRKVHGLAAFAHLREAIAQARGTDGFDTVINLSSTRFSCLIAPALTAEDGVVLGPSTDHHGDFAANDGYSAYLNRWGVEPRFNTIAHHDLYGAAAGMNSGELAGTPALKVPQDRQAAMRRRLLEAGARGSIICVHPFSSKVDKDWGPREDTSRWRALLEGIARKVGQERVTFVWMGAPSERAELEAFGKDMAVRSVTMALGMEDTVALLKVATGLVCVDTVAVHMAAAVGCRAVDLRMGPARAAAFLPGPGVVVVDADDHSPRLRVGDVLPAVMHHLFSMDDAVFDADAATRCSVGVCVRDPWTGLVALERPQWVEDVTLGPDPSFAAWQKLQWDLATHGIGRPADAAEIGMLEDESARAAFARAHSDELGFAPVRSVAEAA